MTFHVRTCRRETVHDITAQCAEFACEASGGGDGLLRVFVPHATAGVAGMELGAGGDADLTAALAGLLPAGERWWHAHRSRRHGRSHILPAVVAPFTLLPWYPAPSRSAPGSPWRWWISTPAIPAGRCGCR